MITIIIHFEVYNQDKRRFISDYLNNVFDMMFVKRKEKFHQHGYLTKKLLFVFWTLMSYYFGLKVLKGIILEISFPQKKSIVLFSDTKGLVELMRLA